MKKNKIIYFDGVCNLCNHTIQTLLKHDKRKQFSFASLQSAAGQNFLDQNNLPAQDFKTFLYQRESKVYARSTAALWVAWDLGGWWRLFAIAWIIPVFIRDAVYNYVSANRYQWFGKQESCWMPTPELKERFL